jgi:hypothetical protein
MQPVTPADVLAGRADELTLLDGYLRDLARGDQGSLGDERLPGAGPVGLGLVQD